MCKISLGEAAKRAGVSRSTMRLLVKAGTVSAQKNELGAWMLEEKELARVFPEKFKQKNYSLNRSANTDEKSFEVPAHNPRRPRPYGGPAPWGIPYMRTDIDHAVDNLCDVLQVSKYPAMATQQLLQNNERIVSRCGMLMTFSSILIGISSYIANNKKFEFTLWQKIFFYPSMLIWMLSTVMLLWSLKHQLPSSPCDFHTESDFRFTAKLYLRRMGLYNIHLIVSVVGFVIMVILLTPISTIYEDFIFGK